MKEFANISFHDGFGPCRSAHQRYLRSFMKSSAPKGRQRKYLGKGCLEHLPPPFYPICGRNHEDFGSEMQVRKGPAPFPQDSMIFVVFE